jgi:pilus assembly protein CpaB
MGRRTLLLIASILVAALGTALIWLYVQGADTRALAGENQVSVYVAARQVAAGQSVTPEIATVKQFPQSVVTGLGEGVVRNTSQIQGYARTDITPGLPLLTTQFSGEQTVPAPAVALAPDEVAMQVTLPDPQRLAGLLQPGSRIRVYAQMKNGSGKPGVGVLFQNVKVLSAGPVTDTTSDTKTSVPQAIVTLALTGQQPKALVLAQAAGTGTLWFGLLPAGKISDDESGLFTSVVPEGQ